MLIFHAIDTIIYKKKLLIAEDLVLRYTQKTPLVCFKKKFSILVLNLLFKIGIFTVNQ